MRYRAVLGAVVALAWLGAPAQADAHLRSGTVAVDYQARVTSGPSRAYTAQIFASDRAVRLSLRRGHTVILIGYAGEPVFRLDAAGMWANLVSPTSMVLRLAPSRRHGGVSGPVWKLRRPGQHSVIWADARTQGLPPGTVRGTWNIPLLVDGHRAILAGSLRRFPAPPVVLWALALAGLVAAGVGPVLLGRRELTRAIAVAAAVVVACVVIVIVLAFSLDAYASPGTWIEAANTIACTGAGVGILVAGPRRWRLAAAGGIGFLGLAVGLLEGAVFLHPIVLAVLPSVAVRLLDVIAIGAGVDAAALAAWFYTASAGVITADQTGGGIVSA